MEDVAEFGGDIAVHALDGWQRVGDDHSWFLIKRFGDLTAHINGTDAPGCSWNVVKGTERFEVLASDSSLNKDAAKVTVAQWFRDNE